MFESRSRAIAGILTPSGAILALFVAGLGTGQYWQYVLSTTIAAMVIGVALVMLVGFARCIMLATGAMMALGAYGTTLLIVKAGWPYIPALFTGTLIGAAGGLALGIPSVRFRSHNLAMVTLVFQAVVIIFIRELKGLTGGAEGLNVPPPRPFGMTISGDLGYLAFTAIAAMIALPLLAALLRGAFGKNLRALAANEVGARAFGISIEAHLVAAFTLSSAAIAFAAALTAPRFRIIDPDSFGLLASIFALAYPIVGGVGSLWGGLVGGGFIHVLPEVLRPVADYTELLLAALVLASVIFLPNGIIGLAQRFRRGQARVDATEPEVSAATTSPVAPAERIRGAALTISDVSVAYGAVRAVDHVSLEVPAGAICGLMGPNGAGKTTLFNAVSGFIVPDSGSVALFGTPLAGAPVHGRIGLGVARTFQQVAIFPTLTCRDNVVIGLGRNGIGRVLGRSFDAAVLGRATREELAEADAALTAVGLGGYGSVPAGALSLGNQRRLEIARAIVSRPRLILLDEPVSGVAHEEAERLAELLRRISRELGVTMLIVEHDIGFLVRLCDRLAAMAQGRIIAEDTPDAVVRTAEVRRVYFGETQAAE